MTCPNTPLLSLFSFYLFPSVFLPPSLPSLLHCPVSFFILSLCLLLLLHFLYSLLSISPSLPPFGIPVCVSPYPLIFSLFLKFSLFFFVFCLTHLLRLLCSYLKAGPQTVCVRVCVSACMHVRHKRSVCGSITLLAGSSEFFTARRVYSSILGCF